MPVLEKLGVQCTSAPEITGIAYDSRRVLSGNAFFCIPGQKTDGNEYAVQAEGKGASCVISEQKQTPYGLSIPYIVVPDVRKAIALIADYYFDHPSSKMHLLGVTGTNGKTTTTHLVEHVFAHASKRIGLIGTLGARWKKADGQSEYLDLHFTTPQASDLQSLLFQMVEAKVTHVSMEVSSHALALGRVTGCQFAVACLTNITQDHLDFHKTMDHYWRSKRMLFEQLNESDVSRRTAIINLDDPLAPEFIKAVANGVTTWTYGFDKSASCHVIDADFAFGGTKLRLQTPQGELTINSRLNGRFNVYNTMAALLICLAEGLDMAIIKEALETFSTVAGRFEAVTSGRANEPLCIVDYAHTPDGLDNVLKAARQLVPKGGKLIAVFGCGGDRDSSKRPQMGEIAENHADEVFVTSDNPRTEDPQQIIVDILAGIKRMRGVTVEPDRASAIRKAVAGATANDIIVIAGKGHETYQILKDKTIDFDDRIEVRKALEQTRV